MSFPLQKEMSSMSPEWRKGAGGKAHTTARLDGSPATMCERSSPAVSGVLAEWTDAFPLGDKEQKEMNVLNPFLNPFIPLNLCK